MAWTSSPGREPILGLGIRSARALRAEVGYKHPTDIEIEVLAYMRGALVRGSATTGARANVLRVGDRAVMSTAASMSKDQRRWAIAHELGHLETHPNLNYFGLCIGEDLLFDYKNSGREQEANAFAAELLMPEDLFGRRCDVPKVKWDPIVAAAEEFKVSVTSAAIRFIGITGERVALVMCTDSKIGWVQATRDFGPRPRRGASLAPSTLAYDFFAKGVASQFPETVDADGWVENARGDEEVVEHLFPMPRYRSAMVLLWFPVRRR